MKHFLFQIFCMQRFVEYLEDNKTDPDVKKRLLTTAGRYFDC